MLFNTAEYIVFFLITSLIYFIVPRKIRHIWLLIASYIFYMNWNSKYALLLAFVTLSTYISAVIIDKLDNRSYQRITMIACVVVDAGLLVYYKYFNFLLHNVNKITGKLNITHFNSLEIILPVGVSFYIFQALSYLFDVYKKSGGVEKDLFRYALFVSFFPQLVAGPIERSENLLEQIRQIPSKSHLEWERIKHGTILIVWGMFMKMVIADRIAIYVDAVFNDFKTYGMVELGLAAIGFAIQIYCDFSGYSTIAVGSACILGFDLMDNFSSPYLSGSIKEFWRRWHISLSTWFRDYIYIPMGGSRCSAWRKYLNILVTMGISGLWHGASWAFVLWGLLHGFYQIMEDVLQKPIRYINSKLDTKTDVFSYKLLMRIVTFALVDFAWVFFRLGGLKKSLVFLKTMLTKPDLWVLFDKSLYSIGLEVTEVHVLFIALIVLLLVDLVQYRTNIRIDYIIVEQNVWFRICVTVVMITAIWVYGIYGPFFDGSQFIYFQF